MIMEINKKTNRFNLALLFLVLTINTSCSINEEDGDLNYTLQCFNWNATIQTKGNSIANLFQASLVLLPEYKRCFTYYNVYLHLLKPNRFKCNFSNGIMLPHSTVLYYQPEQESYEVNFTDLKDGYYCILIEPCAGKCYKTWLASDTVKIEGTQTVTSKENVIKERTSSETSDIPYISVVLILTLIFGVILYWNYKHRKERKIPESIVENEEELPFLKPSDTEVFILYHSDKSTRILVDHLAKFLQKYAEFNVTVIDDRHAPIHIDPNTWLDEHLQCCSSINGKCSCNRRIIIVMTDHVISYMHHKRKTVKALNELAKNEEKSCTFSSCSSDYGGIEVEWFRYGLDKILVDWSKCLKDYTHFLVVYFDDTLYDENDEALMIAPDVRFSIQRHLVRLCLELNNSINDVSRKDKLMKYLDKHPI
ncbi:uncharacterized protein [Parasteatoda tepidariorum]|uniref:uncharacterized protein isoform X3 n=1 Tax=Parasteatoda tepidariorum TaxID=114398 RepID=UPI001C726956|nr:uncharacterized protein LOC107438435 isoform X3 [Parasteatoda tepidariorum]